MVGKPYGLIDMTEEGIVEAIKVIIFSFHVHVVMLHKNIEIGQWALINF